MQYYSKMNTFVNINLDCGINKSEPNNSISELSEDVRYCSSAKTQRTQQVVVSHALPWRRHIFYDVFLGICLPAFIMKYIGLISSNIFK